MTPPEPISVTKAKHLKMIPLTVAMNANDPELFKLYRDMNSIPNTKWALVRERMGMFAVWRVPCEHPGCHDDVYKKRKDGKVGKRYLTPTSVTH